MFNILTKGLDDGTKCTLSNLLGITNPVAFDTSSSRALIKNDFEENQNWQCQVQEEEFYSFSRGRITLGIRRH